MLRTLKYFLSRVYTIISIVLFMLSYGAIQAYAVYYPTDNITNPTCAPGDSGCYVSLLPQVGGRSIVYLPDQTSFSGTVYIGSNGGANLTYSSGTQGQKNTFVGINSGNANTTAFDNTGIGYNALASTTTGFRNTAVGSGALASSTTANFSTAVGERALTLDNGGSNSAFGFFSGGNNLTGTGNNSFGRQSLETNTAGSNNNSFGNFSLSRVTGSNNTAFGSQSGRAQLANADVSNNIFIGGLSGLNISTGGDGNTIVASYDGSSTAAISSGSYNAFMGYRAGANLTTGSYNIALGQNVTLPSITGSGQLNIGNLIYGTGIYSGSSVSSSAITSGKIGIAVSNPVSTLHIGVSPTTSGNYGTLSLGGGAFDGTTSGYFGTSSSSNTNGTSLAINEASGYAGDLINLQKAGVSAFKVDALGNTTITNIDDSTSNPGFIVNSLRAGALSGRFNSFNSQDTGINTSNIGFFSQYKKITNSTNGSAVAFQLYSDAGNNAENITVATQYNMQLYTRNRTTNAVTNQYGLFLANSNISTGSVVNSYGIYISGMPTVTGTSYALYNNTTAPSYFGGNVGIGTITPSAKLSVIGITEQLRLGYDVSNYTSLTADSGGDLAIAPSGGDTNFNTRLGIGSMPGSSFSSTSTIPNIYFNDINSSSGKSTASFTLWANSNTASSASGEFTGLYILTKNSSNAYSAYSATGLSASTLLQHSSGTYSNTYGIHVPTLGQTGGGTIANAYGIRVSDLTNSGGGIITNTYGLYIGDVSSGTQTNTPFSIYSSDASSRNYFAGNVGIGTTSPIAKLDVRGDALFAGVSRITKTISSSESSAEFENGVSIFRGTNNVGWLLNSDSSNNFGLYNWNGAGYVLKINSSGFVGVSQASPSYKLHVGDGTTSGIIARFQNSTGTCDINPTTTSLSCSSDRTLKTNITNLNNTILNQITSLQPVTYTWINDNTNQQQTGFIAQDVEQIFPSLVSTDPTTNLKSLNYIGLIPYAIEGIRELDIKVGQLSSLDDTLEGTFASILKSYLANASNRITRIFTGEVCLTGTDGSSECLNKEELSQLKQLLNNQNNIQQPVPQNQNTEIIPETIPPTEPVVEEVVE